VNILQDIIVRYDLCWLMYSRCVSRNKVLLSCTVNGKRSLLCGYTWCENVVNLTWCWVYSTKRRTVRRCDSCLLDSLTGATSGCADFLQFRINKIPKSPKIVIIVFITSLKFWAVQLLYLLCSAWAIHFLFSPCLKLAFFHVFSFVAFSLFRGLMSRNCLAVVSLLNAAD